MAGTYLCTGNQVDGVRTLSINQDHIDGVNSYTFNFSGEQIDEVRCDKSKKTTFLCNDVHRSRSDLDKFYCDKVMLNIEYKNEIWADLNSKGVKVTSILSKRLFGNKLNFLKSVEQQKTFNIAAPTELQYSHLIENFETKVVSEKNYKCILRKAL